MMMVSMTVQLRNVDDTEAAMGWAGAHTIIADRPEGKAGGLELGFNGAQLLALSIGGCFCNDLRYVAHDLGVSIGKIAVSVTVELEGDPLITTGALMQVHCKTTDGSDPDLIVERAKAGCMVSNSVSRGFPVTIKTD
jgi:organic hydroperoxide reductase OsmC/OhrA